LHLSLDDIKRLTHEAREAIKAKQREEQHWTSAVVLDPQTHPELAARQWRLLVSQLQLLSETASPELLASQLQAQDPQTELCQRVLTAVQSTAPSSASPLPSPASSP
jgi:hypothetical protein